MLTTLLTTMLLYLEGSLFAEIAKWVVMILALLVVLYGVFYALIGVVGARYHAFKQKHPDIKHPFLAYLKREFFTKGKTIWDD